MLTNALLSTVLVLAAQEPAAAPLVWDARHAEHLWNRAGFGADARTIARSVAQGAEATVAELLRADPWLEQPFYARKRADGDLGTLVRSLPAGEREARMRELRAEDRAQAADFLDWWVGRMLAGSDPLVERMTLFWHGYFTSSLDVVQSSFEMIAQNQLFRKHALGSFRDLLHGITRDPAMLVYLDNAVSRKQHPNENFARELMELFTLGEGNYSEDDVHEVARALTGWGRQNGRFRFDARGHDRGPKRVLGVEGRLDGDGVVEILLAQEACARHVARALIASFEGVEPGPERLAHYAGLLRASGYRVDQFLRALFLDPGFYRDEVLASRVSAPLDYLVGCARRLGGDPAPRLIVAGAALLGERLFHPPSVRGWEQGRAWATTSGLFLRGELAGVMLGRVRPRALVAEMRARSPSDEPGAGAASDEPARDGTGEEPLKPAPPSIPQRRRLPPELRSLGREAFAPRLSLTQRLTLLGASRDAELAHALLDELLAIPVPDALAAQVGARIAQRRAELGIEEGALSARPELAEPLLRELAHGILALPEAQLD